MSRGGFYPWCPGCRPRVNHPPHLSPVFGTVVHEDGCYIDQRRKEEDTKRHLEEVRKQAIAEGWVNP